MSDGKNAGQEAKRINMRMKLNAPEAETPAYPEYTYRWDRIFGVSVALLIGAGLITKLGFYVFSNNPDDSLANIQSPVDAQYSGASSEPEIPEASDQDGAIQSPLDPRVNLGVSTSSNELQSNVQSTLNSASTTRTQDDTTLAIVTKRLSRQAAQSSEFEGDDRANNAGTFLATDNLENQPSLLENVLDSKPIREVKGKVYSTQIKRFVLANNVRDREPVGGVDDIKIKTDSLSKIYAYSEAIGMKDEMLFYRWSLNKKEVAKVRVGVWSNRWRSYSTKYIQPQMTGNWTVELLDTEGEVLAVNQFHIKE